MFDNIGFLRNKNTKNIIKFINTYFLLEEYYLNKNGNNYSNMFVPYN